MSNLIEFTGTVDELKTTISGHNGLVVVKFGSTTCLPCKRVKMLLPGMAKDFPQVLFINAEVDLDPERALAKEYNITSVPNIQFFKEGNLVDNVLGAAIPAIKAKLAQYSSN